MLIGKCSCGTVQFSVEDQFLYSGHCHCSQCRRASSSAFSAFGGIQKEKLQVKNGKGSISIFAKNEDDLVSFCTACGSILFSVIRNGGFVHVPLGTLVDNPNIRPTFYIFVGSKAPWYEITDVLPQFAEHAPLDPPTT